MLNSPFSAPLSISELYPRSQPAFFCCTDPSHLCNLSSSSPHLIQNLFLKPKIKLPIHILHTNAEK